MGYDHGDSFPFDFDPNGISFGSKSKGKLSPRSHPIHYERKWKYSFLNASLQYIKNTKYFTVNLYICIRWLGYPTLTYAKLKITSINII